MEKSPKKSKRVQDLEGEDQNLNEATNIQQFNNRKEESTLMHLTQGDLVPQILLT